MVTKCSCHIIAELHLFLLLLFFTLKANQAAVEAVFRACSAPGAAQVVCLPFWREPATLQQSPAAKEASHSLAAVLHRLGWTQALCQMMLPHGRGPGDLWWLSVACSEIAEPPYQLFGLLTDTDMPVANLRGLAAHVVVA